MVDAVQGYLVERSPQKPSYGRLSLMLSSTSDRVESPFFLVASLPVVRVLSCLISLGLVKVAL